MNRSTLAKLAAVLTAGLAATVATVFVVGRDGHHDTTASVKVGQPSRSHPAPTQPPRHTAAPVETFTLTGQVGGLYPGGTHDLTLRVTNPTGTALRVTNVQVTVRDASASCRASNLTAWSYSGRARVGQHATTTVTIPVHMVRNAPNACQNAMFPLVFRAEAVKA